MNKPKQKHPKFLLVDFENIQSIDLSKVDGEIRIVIFIGSNQTKLSTDLVIKSQALGSRLEWRKIEGNGKNAADFAIAYRIGCILTKDPTAECIVLSKDQGFDPLIKTLKAQAKLCKRIENISALK